MKEMESLLPMQTPEKKENRANVWFREFVASHAKRILAELSFKPSMKRNKTTAPNQALQTTTRTVTPAASHPSRQRVSCLI